MKKILVWDIPTRIGHWLLVATFALSYLTGDSEEARLFHVAAGYALGGILIFRLFWAFAGTRYARLKSFLFTPGHVFGYLGSLLKGKPDHWIGHNPAGSYSIYLLVLLGIGTVISGVATYLEIGGDFSEETHDILSYSMLCMVAIHLMGVVVSSVLHKENLARSMVTGYKQGESDEAIESAKVSYAVLPIILATLAGLLVFIT